MTTVSIRRMPWSDDATNRAIVQVPLDGEEQVFDLPMMINGGDAKWDFEWITPVQVSQQYTGVPAPGFTFTIRPPSASDHVVREDHPRAQVVDVFYHLNLVQSFMIGGPHGRIVAGMQYEQGNDPLVDLTVLSTTLAFLVQFKSAPDDDTENTLTHKFQQP